MQPSGIISLEIMLQLGNFAALPRQDKLRFPPACLFELG